MPKNIVSDPITDQEMAFARLVLSGGMTDRQAAEAVALNPDSAAYTKSKPRVREYMLEYRAAVQQQLVEQEADRQHRFILDREQVLERLWELAKMSPEMTRGSMTGQVKALSMIVAMQNLIPDRRARSEEKKSPTAQIYQAEWLRNAKNNDPQPSPAPKDQEDELVVPEPDLAAGPAAEVPPGPAPSQSTYAGRVAPSEEPPPPPFPRFSWVPDTRGGFSMQENPFVRRR